MGDQNDSVTIEDDPDDIDVPSIYGGNNVPGNMGSADGEYVAGRITNRRKSQRLKNSRRRSHDSISTHSVGDSDADAIRSRKKLKPVLGHSSISVAGTSPKANANSILELSNKYQTLTDADDDATDASTTRQGKASGSIQMRPPKQSDLSRHTRPLEQSKTNVTKPKVPSITITAPPSQQLYAIVNNVSNNHKFLGRPSELLVFPVTVECHKRITEELRNHKMPFYTHPLKRKANFKYVLYGIPHMPIDTIRTELEHVNIAPIAVSYLLSKTERDNNVSPSSLANADSDFLRSYVLEFTPGEVTREQIQKISYINRHVCKWREFKTGGNGPTLCHRCCMFGHGQLNCGRDPVCALCAEAHLTSDCRLFNSQNPKAKYRCINCIINKVNHNHRASAPDCPSREIFKTSRARTNTARNNQRPTTNATASRSGFHPRSRSKSRHTQSQQNLSTRAVPRSSRPAAQPHVASINSVSYADATAGRRSGVQSRQNSQQPLFSLEECTTLLFDAVNDLLNCRSKLEQLKVMTNLLNKCLV